MARRKLIWARMAPAMTTLTVVTNAIGGAIETQDLLQTFRTQAGLIRGPMGLTVMRTRLSIYWRTTASTQATDIYTTAAGLYFGVKVDDFVDAVAREAVEFPTMGPQSDPHADWMAWGQLPPKQIITDAAGTGTVAVAGWQDVDVRSMRKVDELGQTLLLAVQGTDAVTAPGNSAYNVAVAASVLLALP